MSSEFIYAVILESQVREMLCKFLKFMNGGHHLRRSMMSYTWIQAGLLTNAVKITVSPLESKPIEPVKTIICPLAFPNLHLCHVALNEPVCKQIDRLFTFLPTTKTIVASI